MRWHLCGFFTPCTRNEKKNRRQQKSSSNLPVNSLSQILQHRAHENTSVKEWPSDWHLRCILLKHKQIGDAILMQIIRWVWVDCYHYRVDKWTRFASNLHLFISSSDNVNHQPNQQHIWRDTIVWFCSIQNIVEKKYLGMI